MNAKKFANCIIITTILTIIISVPFKIPDWSSWVFMSMWIVIFLSHKLSLFLKKRYNYWENIHKKIWE
jgi:hypothetical protein